jgi:hypothetical protein
MKDKELERFEHDGINYIVGVQFMELLDTKIPLPFILVTSKSAKKHRSVKLPDKQQLHFNLLKINNPIVLFRKVYKILDSYLKDKEYLIVRANADKQSKRENVYLSALNKMGFAHNFYCNEDDIFVSRSPINKKVKAHIIKILNENY